MASQLGIRGRGNGGQVCIVLEHPSNHQRKCLTLEIYYEKEKKKKMEGREEGENEGRKESSSPP